MLQDSDRVSKFTQGHDKRHEDAQGRDCQTSPSSCTLGGQLHHRTLDDDVREIEQVYLERVHYALTRDDDLLRLLLAGSERTNAATSKAIFHLASCSRRFWPTQTLLWMILRKS